MDRPQFLLIPLLLAALLTLAGPAGAATEPEDDLKLTLDQMRTLTDVLGHVQRDYVDDTKDQDLLEGAIRGMLAKLDRHSVYLNAEQYARLENDTRGRYGGIGIEVDWRENELLVVGVTTGGPAARAGVVAGDVIVAVAKEPITRDGPTQTLNRVRGPAGTEVQVTFRGPDGAERELLLTREVIRIVAVHGNLLDGGLGYIKIGNFQVGTERRTREVLGELTVQNGAPLNGLILDVRGNPGGVLSAAVGISDLFLTEGRIVSTRGRDAEPLASYDADPEDVLDGAAMVVLVDNVSASASEIVAGALKDHDRATLMGKKTFGKGSVQTVLPLRNGGAVKLTTAKYYTPQGVSIQGEGVAPHVKLETRPDDNGLDRALLEATQRLRSLHLARSGEPVE
ncbi:MAG: S41 family peptidase [Pseudomonadota bacterium]